MSAMTPDNAIALLRARGPVAPASILRIRDRAAWSAIVRRSCERAHTDAELGRILGVSRAVAGAWRREVGASYPAAVREAPAPVGEPSYSMRLDDGRGWSETHPLDARSDKAACYRAGRVVNARGRRWSVRLTRLDDGATCTRTARGRWSGWSEGGCTCGESPHALACERVLG